MNVATQQIIIGAAVAARPGTPWASRTTAPIRWPWPTSATAPPAKATSTKPWSSRQASRPRGLHLPEQPLGISEPVIAAVPHPDRGPRLRLRHSEHAVDGNDVLARDGPQPGSPSTAPPRRRTPTFIEAVTYRMGPHTTADDPTRTGTPTSFEDWAAKDPIERLQDAARAQGTAHRRARCRRRSGKRTAVAKELRAGTINMAEPQPLDISSTSTAHPTHAGPPAGPLHPLLGFLRRSRRSRFRRRCTLMTQMTFAEPLIRACASPSKTIPR